MNDSKVVCQEDFICIFPYKELLLIRISNKRNFLLLKGDLAEKMLS